MNVGLESILYVHIYKHIIVYTWMVTKYAK